MTILQDHRHAYGRPLVWIGAVVLGIVLSAGSAAARPLVEEVSVDRRSDGMGYVIRFHTTEFVSGYYEPQRVGDELEIQLFNVDLARRYKRPAPAGPVLASSEHAEGGHLVFRFRLDPELSVEADIYRDRLSTDILVGLTYRDDRAAELPVPARPVAARPVAARVEQAGRSRRAPETDTDAAAGTARSEGERWRLDTIVIDAGHGGKDPGAQANGVREKDVVLDVARRVGEYIEQNLGCRVVYTRSDDRFVELQDRGRIANAAGAKLFISIHVNSAANRQARGTETYFLGMHKTDAARRVMERENEVVKLESNPNQYEKLDGQELIRQTLLQSANMRKSEELAGLVERQFSERVGRPSRGVKQAGFYVLWGASMPAILIELGFVSNPEEAAFLNSESGKAYMASAIFRAVREYKEDYEKGLLVHTAR